MFTILLCLISLWSVLGTRIGGLRQRIVKSPQYARECGTTENERELALGLHYELQACLSEPCKNPFTSCSGESRYVSLSALAEEPLKLCTLGKLAKNGNFFTSENQAVLVKRVDKLEAAVLTEWGEWVLAGSWSYLGDESQYPGGCPAFDKSLLISMFASFTWDDSPYVVMPNMTHYLEQVTQSRWLVHAVYDTKPLPNLGEGLVKLFKDLQNQWGNGLPKLNEWNGWSAIRSQLLIDLQFLEDRVVDFSLFVHVLKSQGKDGTIPEPLESSNACAVDPSKKIMVCFNILDYLTPLTWKRKIESKYKASKFDDYGSKFLQAFDCIGDASQSECANYDALTSITEAMSVSKAMAKAAFIGVQAFPTAYTCTDEEPHVEYKQVVLLEDDDDEKTTKGFGEKIDLSNIRPTIVGAGTVAKEVDWKSSESSADVAQWLQSIATPEAGTQYVGKRCEDDSSNMSAYNCVSATIEEAYLSGRRMNPEHEDTVDYWTRQNMDECVELVNQFATEGYRSWGNHTSDMHNVLWAPSQKSVIVVRGLPRMPVVRYSHYQHKSAVERARERSCFLKMRYLRCTPTESAGVYFNYKQHFGTLEVMVLSTQEQYSADAEAYALLTKEGYHIVTSLEMLID